jgi:hypothetical protein
MSYRQTPGSNVIFVAKSTDAGKTFPQVAATFPATSQVLARREGNIVVDPYNGNIYTSFRPQEANGHTRAELWFLKSTDGGATWSMTQAYQGPAGTDIGNVFPVLAVDHGGNIHLAFSQCDFNSTTQNSSNCSVYLMSSGDQGSTWLPPVKVNNGIETSYAIMPWIAAGSPGVVDITWYGANITNSTQAADWHLYFSQVTNAMSASPVLSQVQAIPQVVHNEDICLKGGACGGNRDLAEYYQITLDRDGNANIAFTDDVTNNTSGFGHTWFTKQTGGSSAFTPTAPPAAASFGPNVNVAANGGGGGEPNSKVDSHNCIFSAAPGNPDFWKSVNNGTSFLAPVNPVADETGVTGGDEDILTLPRASGARPDILYFADLGISSVHIRKSTDGGATWFAPGTNGTAGEVSISSDRQWLAYDRFPSANDTTLYEMDHELVSEDIRFSASTNDGAWASTSGITNPELLLPPDSTIPNTNPGPAFTFLDPSDNTHKVAGVFTASTVRTNRAQPPFGKLPNVWEAIGAAPATAGAPPGPFTDIPIFKGVQDSPTTPPPPVGSTTFGNNTANDFPTAAIDGAGNIYVAWAMNDARINHFNVWYASSHDHGKSFYGPFQVSSGPGHAVMPWMAAGDAGRLEIVFYQTNGTQDPNTSTTDRWKVMFAQSLNAADREPVFTITQASDHFNHTGAICNLGLLCASGTRNLLDFFQVAIGPDGLANIVYTDDSSGSRHPEFARQTTGPLALTNPVVRTCLPLPDLIASNLTATNNQARQGQKIPLTATIKNQGEATAGASKTGFYLDGKLLGQVTTPQLNVGESFTATFNWNTSNVKKGNHNIQATADSTQVVNESIENNNTSNTITIFIQGNRTK